MLCNVGCCIYGYVFLRHALQCGLLHLWVCDLMVSMLTGHLEGAGVLGGPLFTKVQERVEFHKWKIWCG